MFEATIFVPVASNAGQVFEASHHEVFELLCLRLFGGLSLLPGLVSGKWLGGAVVYRDDLRQYVVACNGLADCAKVIEAAGFAARHYGQEAIYLRYLGQAEIYTPPANEVESKAA